MNLLICIHEKVSTHQRINMDNLTGPGVVLRVLYEKYKAYVVLVHRWWFFGSHHQHTASRAESERGLTFNQNANNKRRSGRTDGSAVVDYLNEPFSLQGNIPSPMHIGE